VVFSWDSWENPRKLSFRIVCPTSRLELWTTASKQGQYRLVNLFSSSCVPVKGYSRSNAALVPLLPSQTVWYLPITTENCGHHADVMWNRSVLSRSIYKTSWRWEKICQYLQELIKVINLWSQIKCGSFCYTNIFVV